MATPNWYYQPTTTTPVNTNGTNQLPQNSQSNLMVIFVSSENEVEYYPVAAGLTVMLISFNLGKFWLKSTGMNGIPMPLRVFEFNEKVATNYAQGTASSTANPAYVTHEEFSALSTKINKLLADLGGDK